jgi:hypothetical protein
LTKSAIAHILKYKEISTFKNTFTEAIMKIINGYCCLANIRGNNPMQVLFGKNEGQGQGSYCAMAMNKLIPFTNKRMAKTAKSELRHRNDIISVAIAEFYLTIAEKEVEIDQLPAKSNYVVIWE